MTLTDQAILAVAANGQQIICDAEPCGFFLLLYQTKTFIAPGNAGANATRRAVRVTGGEVGEIKARVAQVRPQNPSRCSSPRTH